MLNNLSYFLTVARHQSISRAAEELYISQPALSAAMMRLEKQLDVKLFERRSGGIRLTVEGECVAGYARELCSSYERMTNDLQLLRSKAHGLLRVGSGMRHAVNIVDSFLYKYPSENVLLTQYNSYYELKQALLNQEIDLCLSAPPVEGACVTTRQLCVERLCAVFGKDLPMQGREEIELHELVNMKLLALPNGFSLRVVIDEVFKQAGLTPKYRIQAENSALAELLGRSRSMDYVAIYPLARCLELQGAYPDLKYLPIAGRVCRSICASWLDKTPISPQFRLMLNYLEEYYGSRAHSREESI